MPKLFGREPTLYLAVISTIIVLIGTFGFKWLDGNQAALLVAAINALAGAFTAFFVRPVSPAIFTYAIGALAAVAAAYGLKITPEQLGMLNLAVIAILGFMTRGQVSPVDTALTRRTTADEKAVAEPQTGAPPAATVTN